MLVLAAGVMVLVTKSNWYRTRYLAYDPHQKCLAVKPAAECESLRP